MEENAPVVITPYYWRNREKVLRKIAEKKATPEGREAFNEYQREYQKRYKARKLAVAKEIRREQRTEFIKRISAGSVITPRADPPGIPAGAPAPLAVAPAMRLISEVPAGWTPPAGNFVISKESWR